MDFAHPITVVVRRSGTDPRSGDPLPDPVDHDIDGCAVAPRASTEATDLGNAVIVGLTLFAPYGADITATDWVLLPGGDPEVDRDWWFVDGDPGDWRSPFTDWRPGTQVALTRQRG